MQLFILNPVSNYDVKHKVNNFKKTINKLKELLTHASYFFISI